MLLNCGVGEDSWESLGLQGDPTSPTFIGRTDAEAVAPMLWPPDTKSRLIGKDPNAGKDWRQEEKGTAEDEMFGCHHRLNGLEFEQALGVGDGQGSLACCSSQGHKESDTTKTKVIHNLKLRVRKWIIPKWMISHNAVKDYFTLLFYNILNIYKRSVLLR